MLAAMKKSMENYWMRVSTSGELFVFLLVTYLIPSIHPGNGSFRTLVMMLGRTMTTGRSPRRCPSSISPMALVNT
jgi:hypothetical protein